MKTRPFLVLCLIGILVLLGTGTIASAFSLKDKLRYFFLRDRADHTTFTSQSEDAVACACPRKNFCRIHATFSNLDTESAIDIKFQDGDLVTIFVPPGTSKSLTQVIGTRDDANVDDIIIFDPRDNGSLNPIVGWVSIERLGDYLFPKKDELFGCTTIPLNGS
jgi:hypothetical protein